jgi:LytS/YehU family sensor histidine kinase
MLIQLLVENGIKHGIGRLKSGGKIFIETSKTGENLSIKVSNSGSLPITDGKSATGIGLHNLKERLKLIYKNRALFSLSEENDFVTATIIIPYEEA